MDNEEAKRLIDGYLAGTCTPEEQAHVERHYGRLLETRLRDAGRLDYPALKAGLDQRMAGHPRRRRLAALRSFRVASVAAALIAALSVAWYFMRDGAPATGLAVVDGHAVTPGGNKATLLVNGGAAIALSDAQAGIVVKDGTITYSDGGSVAGLGAGSPLAIEEYRLQTPNGGTYQVALPDGSTVWLNAASSLRYPARFAGAERIVELVGEAYFSISKDTHRPFKVYSGDQEVTVLGTEFNVSAYPGDPAIRTTLVEGAVSVTVGHRAQPLAPGQQAVNHAGDVSIVTVDTEPHTSWRQGRFLFSDEPLSSIMRKIGRWYDVDVEYRGVDATERYVGGFSRYDDLDAILDHLAYTGKISFTISGRRIIVSKP